MALSQLKDLSGWLSPRNKRFWLLAAILLYTVAGFLVLPWALKSQISTLTQSFAARDATVGEVRFNPWTLRLQANDFVLLDDSSDSSDTPLAGFSELVVNLETRSLLKLAIVLSEFSLSKPEINLTRYGFADTNFGRMLDDIEAAEAAAAEQDGQPVSADAAEEDGGLRLIIDNLQISEGALNLADQMPNTPFNTRLAPIDISIVNLNTLPDGRGEQQITIVAETGGTLRWNGYLQVNPLISEGKIDISGSILPLLTRYFKDDIPFGVQDCCIDIAFGYAAESLANGDIRADLDGISVSLRELELSTGDERILELPEFRISGGKLRWPEQTLSIEEVRFDQPDINIWLDKNGMLNLEQLLAAGTPAEAEPVEATAAEADPQPNPANETSSPSADAETAGAVAEADAAEGAADAGKSPEPLTADATDAAAESTPAETPAAEASTGTELLPDWDIRLDALRIDGLKLRFEDRSLPKTGVVEVGNADLTVSDISNAAGATWPLTLTVGIGKSGTLDIKGKAGAFPDVNLDAEMTLAELPVSLAQPWVEPLARVSIDGGMLNLTGQLSSKPDEQLDFTADIELAKLAVQDLDAREELIGWDALRLKNTHLQLDAAVLDISLIELVRPFAKLVIAADGSTNFSDLQTEQGSESESTAPATGETEESFTIKIGKTTVEDGSMDFADFSLPLPFKAPISELGGSISTLATDTTQPSEIDLEGKVAKYGFVSIAGTASLMAPTEQTAIEAKFRNVDMPSLSPYTAEFAGRKIASGKLDLDLNYTLDKEQMAGENKIVIETFELGEKVENPDAMDLPLDLAVALLKDVNGVIDLKLGVSGDMNDPSFSASGIVLKAFANLITKAAAAPFKLLGSLIPGGGETDFDAVEFQPGRADLMPPEQQKLDQLAAALRLRPNLILLVPAGYGSESDITALQAGAVEQQIEELLGDKLDPDADADKLVKQTRKALEKLADRQLPDVSLRDLREEYTREPPDGGRAKLDEQAYSAGLRSQLEQVQVIDEAQLTALAESRRAAIIGQLQEGGGLGEKQLKMLEPAEYPVTDEGWVRIEMQIEAGSGRPPAADEIEAEAAEASDASGAGPDSTEFEEVSATAEGEPAAAPETDSSEP